MPQHKLKTIGVVVGPQKNDAEEIVSTLSSWCEAQGIELKARWVEGATALPQIKLLAEADGELDEDVNLIVALGGDGTMLGVARFIGGRQISVLGINLGSLGYLTEFTSDELSRALEAWLEGRFIIDQRMMLDVKSSRDGKIIAEHRALNEAVLNISSRVRMIEIECRINEMFVNSFRADGMIVATPTGSTAYSLSAGGPIVHPSMSAIVLTPICPHTLSNRPVIVPGDSVVDLFFQQSEEDVMLTIDGQVAIELKPGDQVSVSCSQATFDLIRPTNRNYFEVLRRKLKWGTR